MSFAGLRVLALESRRTAEIGTLIRNQGGEPVLAPSVREIPIEGNGAALDFYDRLNGGQFDLVILMTGVGTRALDRAIGSVHGPRALADALSRVPVVPRGPKPTAVLREWGIVPAATVPEPNTWRELLEILEGRPERRIAIQEYGVSNERLIEALRARGAEVTPVAVYEYALPEDTRPLEEAARQVAAGEIDVVLLTTSSQALNLLEIARRSGIDAAVRDGLNRAVVASIGPTTSETLHEHGIEPDVVPSHPKMGFLVKESAEAAGEILRKKRA